MKTLKSEVKNAGTSPRASHLFSPQWQQGGGHLCGRLWRGNIAFVVIMFLLLLLLLLLMLLLLLFIPMVVMKRWYRVYTDYVVVGDGGHGEARLFWHGIQQEKEVCSNLHTLTWQWNILVVFDGRKFLWSWIICWIKRLMKKEWRYFVFWNSN